jgi:L-cysteine desulfidase
MNLKEFNPQNSSFDRSSDSTPRIGINRKVGLFRFNEAACKLIGIEDNDQVKILQDLDDKTNWYVEKVKQDGFVVRHKEKVGNGCLFNSTKIANEYFNSLEIVGDSIKVLVAGKPTDFNKRKLFGMLSIPA